MSIIKELEFRSNFVVNIANDLIWLAFGLFSIDVLFTQLSSIGGLGKTEVQLLLFVNSLFLETLWFLTLGKLAVFSGLIQSGDLDFTLTKPLNDRLLVSFATVPDYTLSQFAKLVIYFLLVVTFVVRVGLSITIAQWLTFAVLLVIGLVVFYCLGFMIATLNVWLVKLDSVGWIVDAVVDAGKNPFGIWRGVARAVVWIIPLGYTANFATQTLLSPIPQTAALVIGIVIAFLLLLVSEAFWRFAIRHYASASS